MEKENKAIDPICLRIVGPQVLIKSTNHLITTFKRIGLKQKEKLLEELRLGNTNCSIDGTKVATFSRLYRNGITLADYLKEKGLLEYVDIN